MEIFKKEYDGENIVDIERDVIEAINVTFNPMIAMIDRDENGIQKGKFIVTIEWEV